MASQRGMPRGEFLPEETVVGLRKVMSVDQSNCIVSCVVRSVGIFLCGMVFVFVISSFLYFCSEFWVMILFLGVSGYCSKPDSTCKASWFTDTHMWAPLDIQDYSKVYHPSEFISELNLLQYNDLSIGQTIIMLYSFGGRALFELHHLHLLQLR